MIRFLHHRRHHRPHRLGALCLFDQVRDAVLGRAGREAEGAQVQRERDAIAVLQGRMAVSQPARPASGRGRQASRPAADGGRSSSRDSPTCPTGRRRETRSAQARRAWPPEPTTTPKDEARRRPRTTDPTTPRTVTMTTATAAAEPAAAARRRAPAAERWAMIARAVPPARRQEHRPRVGLVAIGFLGLFGAIGGRLVYLALADDRSSAAPRRRREIAAARPDIVDRNGEILATDIKIVSVFAEPRKIVDKDEAVELLTAVLPDLDARELREKLGARREGLRLGQARDHAAPAGRGAPARHPRRRLPAREQAHLSERRRRRRMCSASPTSTTSASPASRNTSTARACRT